MPSLFFSNVHLIRSEIERLEELGSRVYLISKHKDDIPEDLKKYIFAKEDLKSISKNIKYLNNLEIEQIKFLPAGFISSVGKTAIFTDRELFGSIFLNKVKTINKSSARLKQLLAQFEGEIKIGDYIAHEDYGIGLYSGLTREEYDSVLTDYLLVKFAGDDEIYVPLIQIEKITKYLGNSDSPPKLTKLSKGGWKKLKEKVKKTTVLLAKHLIEHMAKRELSKAVPIDQNDSQEYKFFVESFPYNETRDQINVINEVINDMKSTRPMNRLVVGDVGFGKTEVIMRAVFKVIEQRGQVAVLSPTTILTSQHLATFRERFELKSDGDNPYDIPMSIEAVSRFNTVKENREVIDRANNGDVSVLIGTHRLLTSDVKFKDLQLVVIDEEQKFGVKQKEKIKQINYGVHMLSVSATPIPRTLSLALSSIQDISVITTPPKGRRSIDTEMIYTDWNKVADAISKEHSRGGQAYFLHNRVETIAAIKEKLSNLLPGIKFEFAHGKMSASQLDRIMTDFYLNKFDVLISTTIIENGLDLPNVNTMIIHDAHRLGLSQLYQLRGRVGRGDRQAYCYLMCPRFKTKTMSVDETKTDLKIKSVERSKLYLERLQSLVENSDLGAGFQIASKDLEIRGAGSILGEKQHGHITEIGYALYIEMLAGEIEMLKEKLNLP
ncbi:MAG: helicase-related protein [Candidatus Dojkabacteria bacterium]|nr:helicase-related protein [Candidatus Dojkabacteria bacterium]MDQ7020510.1 helicase-related protein [Candidatus Dojkabacteria bacterium]